MASNQSKYTQLHRLRKKNLTIGAAVYFLVLTFALFSSNGKVDSFPVYVVKSIALLLTWPLVFGVGFTYLKRKLKLTYREVFWK
jgi:hypothetical protein